ncbi:hypothetical protein YC2023_083197 [Brassica napus]
MGITVLFIDEKVNSVIHGFISAGRANHYMPSLKAGSIVKVDHFEVARCSSMYKIIDHPFLIRFISPTIIDEVITGGLLRSISNHNKQTQPQQEIQETIPTYTKAATTASPAHSSYETRTLSITPRLRGGNAPSESCVRSDKDQLMNYLRKIGKLLKIEDEYRKGVRTTFIGWDKTAVTCHIGDV